MQLDLTGSKSSSSSASSSSTDRIWFYIPFQFYHIKKQKNAFRRIEDAYGPKFGFLRENSLIIRKRFSLETFLSGVGREGLGDKERMGDEVEGGGG